MKFVAAFIRVYIDICIFYAPDALKILVWKKIGCWVLVGVENFVYLKIDETLIECTQLGPLYPNFY